MRGHAIYFYATRDDLEPVIRSIEATASFNYVLTGLQSSRIFPTYSSGLEIPSLGRATGQSAVHCEAYLVVPKETQVLIRDVPQRAGGVMYAVDQLINPDSIVFQPGGVLDDSVVISGEAGTTAQTEKATEIFSLFRKWLKNDFQRRQSFYVGPNALQLKEKGSRLTANLKSPREYDLA
jgi:hypothetical protein